MSDFPERRAGLFRLRLRLKPNQVADAQVIWALVELLGPCLEVKQEPGATANFQPRRDGGARITVPLLADERQEALITAEEIAHYVCRFGIRPPSVNRHTAPYAEVSLDELREADDEEEARRFVDALYLPEDALKSIRTQHDVWDLAEDTGVSPEMIQRRLRRVKQQGRLILSGPEPWSAWSCYRVELVRGAVPQVRVVSVDGREPVIDIPLDGRRPEDVIWQVHADLAALRPLEFRLKYSVEQAEGEDADLLWDEFLAGAAGLPFGRKRR